MYDALQECWVNASLDKAAGAYVGPTAEYNGLPGMLPGAPAGSENLFFRSDGKWVELNVDNINPEAITFEFIDALCSDTITS